MTNVPSIFSGLTGVPHPDEFMSVFVRGGEGFRIFRDINRAAQVPRVIAESPLSNPILDQPQPSRLWPPLGNFARGQHDKKIDVFIAGRVERGFQNPGGETVQAAGNLKGLS